MEAPSYLAVLRNYLIAPTLTAETAYENINWNIPTKTELDALLAAYTAEYEAWRAEQADA